MANNQDDQDLEFTLDDILAEFGHGKQPQPDTPPAPPPVRPSAPPPRAKPEPPKRAVEDDEPTQRIVLFPHQAPPLSPPLTPPVTDAPTESPEPPPPARAAPPKGKRLAQKSPAEPPAAENIVGFPVERPTVLSKVMSRLRSWTENQAEHMYEEEDSEHNEEVLRAERYIPGVDVEDEQDDAPIRERKPRRVIPEAPDTPPGELTRRYSKGLPMIRVRGWLVFLLFLALSYLTMGSSLALPMPQLPSNITISIMAGLLLVAMLLGADVLLRGFFRIFLLRFGMDTLLAFACVATMADTLTMHLLERSAGQMPFCAISALGIAISLWGTYHKRKGLRLACRVAASAKEPYLVTLDEAKWNSRDAYVKWSGAPVGFGRQIQSDDGAQRIFSRICPLLLIACILFSVMSSVGCERPQDILWCLSAMLTVTAALSASLCFALPWDALSARLSSIGAAVAGWGAAADSGGRRSVILTDFDLFPPGTIILNGVKVFGDFSVSRVVSLTATLIHDSGSGLDKLFHDLLRSQGATYRRTDSLERHEAGGLIATVRNERILVGASDFMNLMEIPLPTGLNIKNGVFCAIDGELAALFTLSYVLYEPVENGLYSLIQNKATPVLATRDFNIVPVMLKHRFGLPVEKMEFPSIARRCELSEETQEHSPTLTAVLCREGIRPYADAVVAVARLRRATHLSAFLTCFGAVLGLLLTFYLTFVAGYSSLSPFNLLVYLVMWTIPTLLISGWAKRY